MTLNTVAVCPDDPSISPFVGACRGGFDFTLRFERIFLAFLPGAFFIVLALPRAAWLSRRPRILHGHALQFCKLILITTLIALQSALLGVQTLEDASSDGWAIAAGAMQLAATLCLLPLSFLEHARTARPSMLITIFILVQVAFDAVMVRTAWLITGGSASHTTARLSTASLVTGVLILLAETRRKTRWLRWNIDEHSPEETSGIISLSVFLWLNRLFLRGYRSLLAVENLYPLDLAMDSKILQKKLDAKFARYPRGAKFGLSRALAGAFPLQLLLPAVPRLALIGFTFAQPFFIQALLRYLQQPQASENFGYGLIGASGLIFGGMALAKGLYAYFHDRFLCMVRGALSGAIYARTSRSRLSSSDDSAAVTLVSTDTERVVRGLNGLHEFWANAAEIAVGSWLLYRQIGASFAAPFVLMLVGMVLVGCIGKLIGRRQAAWMELVQRRVGATADAVADMTSIKLGGMAGPVSSMVESMRAAELGAGNAFRWLFIITIMASIAPPALSPLFVLVFASGEMETTTMFTALSFVVLLTTPLVQGIRSVPKVIGAFTCLGRIQAFLEEEEHADFRRHGGKTPEKNPEKKDAGYTGSSCPGIVVENGSFGWVEGKMVLSNLNISFPASKLTVVVGPTASGKSTLCKALLGETPFASGVVHIDAVVGAVGFCDSTPFLYNTTVRDNIIAHSGFDRQRYEEVIEACMLCQDLLALAHGDETCVGSNGSGLSGGQRQRVALGRAMYAGSALVVLDDVVKGLDNDTASEMLWRLFGQQGLIRRQATMVVLCTHSALPLTFADHVVALGSDGTVVEQGAPSDLADKQGYVASLFGSKKTSGNGAEAEVAREVSIHPSSNSDMASRAPQAVLRTEADTALKMSRLHGDRGVYRHYLGSISVTSLTAATISALFCALAGSFGTLWLKYWAEDTLERPKAFYAGIFGLAQGTQLLMSLAACVAVAISAITRSGAALHAQALSAVVRAPPGLLADVGAITTLFAQDMTLVDGELPLALLNVLIGIFEALVRTAVVAVASPWLALGYPLIAGVLWAVQRFYLRTSRQLRLLDLETKGPMITHFLDTIRGLATIRAFGWTEGDVQRGHTLLTDSQRPAYLLSMIQNWLGLTLDLAVAVVAVVVVSLATQTRSNAGFTGASLVMLMTLSQVVTRLMRFYTELETSIGAVARIKAFSERVPVDMAGEDMVPPESWPAQGTIRIGGISAGYGSEDERGDTLALKDLTLEVQAGKKVAICGRSGNGKSSIILLLMRLLEPQDGCRGHIEIDGLPLHRIDKTKLRQRVLTVPQDTVFLPSGASIKENLDLSSDSADAECQDVLRLVGLDQLMDIHADLKPDILSAGQKQLFSLARVILRRRARSSDGGVLLLDELSAGVDGETERVMQEVVGREFVGYTVVAVSHRLGLVTGYYDEGIFMEEGCVVERGDPAALVLERDSHFARLLRLEGERL